MPYAPVNGIHLYYEVHGSGPAVLFAHGQGGNHLSWHLQVEFFAQRFTCITFDHRAFGLSIDADQRGRSAFGLDAIALLDHLGIEQVDVVAHSMGGRTGIALALRDPERCRSLVLGGNIGGVTNPTILELRRAALEARGDRGLGAFSVGPGFRKAEPERYRLLRAIGRLNPPRPKDFLTAPGQRMLPPTEPRQTISERLIARGLPLMFIVGEFDQITPPAVIEQCHMAVPGSRYHMVRGSGHSAYFEKPDEFNQQVLDFLSEVASPD